jgi:aminoglycoside phosphotransferase (APT) family kinase protein
MNPEPDDALVAFLCESGVIRSRDEATFTPLAGGVSSDIWKVETPARVVCVKRALAQLKVDAAWFAPVERNVYEVRWLQTANAIVPGVAPEVIAQDAQHGLFAMSYAPPQDYPVWKSQLRTGRADPGFAARVGDCLARIHAGTAGDDAVAKAFASDAIFYDIRLDPYLLATAGKHADCASRLQALVDVTRSNRRALVHGDVSPKNILVSPDLTPVFLDAECAWYGDPAFDLAFCLNHLLLKCLWVPAGKAQFLAAFDAMSRAYLARVDWEPAVDVQARACALLPGLMLGRVDGKSPVEYITTDVQRNTVRGVARRLLLRPVTCLQQVSQTWSRALCA